MTTYPSEAAAIAALKAEGFHLTESGSYWAKRGKVDDWYGGYETTALVEVQHNRVGPKWNAPDYWTWRWA